tara:strand:+ start:261 stop:767 length:507 start_codon:yes stop_codon:yes gene_type:complete
MNKNIFLSLGSNLGNKTDNLKNAINFLGQNENIFVIKKSDIFQSSPMYNIDQDDYYNMVVKIETNFNPLELLDFVKFAESKIGRKVVQLRNMPRLIDIDILTFDKIELNTKELTIPHRKISERKFVLLPWMDIAPNFCVPKINKKVGFLFKNLVKDDNIVDRLSKEYI